MSNKKYDYIVFIGRFQPFHIGHLEVVREAIRLARKQVIVLIGSCNKPRSTKNPWLFHERVEMITSSLTPAETSKVGWLPLLDHPYNEQRWAAGVQNAVEQFVGSDTNASIGIIGHTKDDTSYYLKMFPQWDQIEHGMNEQVSATDLRNLLFSGKSHQFLSGVLPPAVFDYVDKWSHTEHHQLLRKEYAHIAQYKKSWSGAPYPVTFVTVDAVVVQSGHILLIERDAAPGEGLLALPGGFLNQNERIDDGVLRELREETRLKVPLPVLRGSIIKRAVFDDPHRSERGRTITHVALIELPPGELPPVKGSDDARAAQWVPISDVSESNMFEDHYAIIQSMLG